MTPSFRSFAQFPATRLCRLAAVALGCSLLTGCITHDVAFDNASYTVPKAQAAAAGDTAVIVVLDQQTLAQKHTVHSWMTGIGNKWDAAPGEMLRDVVQIEMPQAFGQANLASEYAEPDRGNKQLTVVLTIPSYVFTEFRATIDVRAVAYKPGRVQIFDKTYHAEGFTQGSKMAFGGAFAMKSAIRQSSLDAYKKIFAQLRQDMDAALTTSP